MRNKFIEETYTSHSNTFPHLGFYVTLLIGGPVGVAWIVNEIIIAFHLAVALATNSRLVEFSQFEVCSIHYHKNLFAEAKITTNSWTDTVSLLLFEKKSYKCDT